MPLPRSRYGRPGGLSKGRYLKFSHHYKKIGGAVKGRLLLVEIIMLQHQTKSFLDYDTENGLYSLPEKGDRKSVV